MPDDPKEPRHLTVLPPRKKKAVAKGEPDMLAQARKWWDAQDLTEMATLTTLGQAFTDVGMMCLAHAAKRMSDKDTPASVKDSIMKTIVPRVHVQITPGKGKGRSKAGVDLLEAYKIGD